MSNVPRILSLTGTPHPQALVTGINPGAGILGFRWLDGDGNPVDSGGSVARFAPQIGAEDPVTREIIYDEIADATLIDAIENPIESVQVPEEVTRRQLLLALYGIGITRDMIRGMLAGNEAALIEYDEALTFKRSHPLIAQLGAALGKTSGDIDALFVAAGAI